MTKKPEDLFDQFDTSKWKSQNENMEQFLNRPIVVYSAIPGTGPFGDNVRLAFVDTKDMTLHSVATSSQFLMAMGKQFASSDMEFLPIIVTKNRQALEASLSPDTNLSEVAKALSDN